MNVYNKLALKCRHMLSATVVAGMVGLIPIVIMPLSANAQLSAPALPRGVTLGINVEGIQELKLSNGLQVLLIADDSKPSVTINLTYLVGSRHENYGETGMAHLLEHMLFKGTKKFPMVWAEFNKRGMRANGTTWTDRTNYFASFSYSPEAVEWYMKWLADSMTNSTILKSDLDTEMTVVRNEMEMGENNSFRVIIERMMSTAYQWHNYSKSTIGARADVENVDIGRLQAFYRMYYQPDNAVLIVSGKFDQARILKLLGEDFAKIPKPTRTLPKVVTIDSAQDGERTVVARRPAGAALVLAGYHMPPAGHPDGAAVDMLEDIMGDTPSGRLYKAIVDPKLAASTFGFGFKFREPSYSFFGAQLPPTLSTEAVRSALVKTLDEVATKPITNEELERARTKWLKAWELAFTDPEQIGVSLSEAIAAGDWRLFFLKRDQVKAVKVEDVQRVVTQYLLPDNRTIGLFIPTEKPQRAPKPATVDVTALVKDYKGGVAMAQGEAFTSTPENIEARTERVNLTPDAKAALLYKRTRGAVVTATLRMGIGSLESLKGNSALAGAVMSTLDRGTATMTRAQIADAFAKLKADVSVGGSSTEVDISIQSPKDNFIPALTLALDIVRNASFPDAQIEEYKTAVVTSIREAEKDPGGIGRQALARHLNPFSSDDPRYAASFAEQIQRTESLKAADLRAFHKRFISAADVQIGIVGEFDVAKTKSFLASSLANWKADVAPVRIPSVQITPKPGLLKFETPDKQNAYLGMRLPMPIEEGTAEYAAMLVADQIFSASQNSRLWVRVREKEGISYGVGSSLSVSSFEVSGMWSVGGIYAPQNLTKMRNAINEELARALKDGFTDKEVNEAVASILRERELNRAQDAVVASSLQFRLRQGKTFLDSAKFETLLKAVKVDSANAVFRKYVKPELIVTAVAGDFAKNGQ